MFMKTKGILMALLAAMFLFTGCAGEKNKDAQGTDKSNEVKAMSVDEVVNNIDAYVSKDVHIKGTVEHVCKHGGKRLHLMNNDGSSKIRVESGDAITQFDRELEGEEINVKGTVKKLVIDEAYLDRREDALKKEDEKHEHEEGEHEEKNSGNTMLHRVNSLEQVENLRKQLKEESKKEIVSYWMKGKEYQKCESKEG